MKKFSILLATLFTFSGNFAKADGDYQAIRAAKAKVSCPSPCPAGVPCPAIPACPSAAPCPAAPSPCAASHGVTGHANNDQYIFNSGNVGTVGHVGSDSMIGLAVSPVDHMLVSGSVGLEYLGNLQCVANCGNVSGTGLPDPIDARWKWSLGLSAEYMVVDSCPFAMGPQIAAAVSFFDSSYNQVVITPGWNFWFSPFNAPVGIGTSLGLSVILKKDHEPAVKLQSPGLKLVYLFN